MRRAALATLLGAVAATAVPASAVADDPPPLPPPAPQPAPAPAPAPKPSSGRITLDVLGGMVAGKRSYVLTGDNVTVVGHIKPFVAGQTVRVRISTAKRKPTVIRAKVRKGKGE